ncbi:glycosyltransferase family 4 protein [Sphingobacterium paludis]|uniref:Glycosyltransferase involved in cell wall biosynthesis n=1 Tax=Sphingobacterium paludis TaxID=1476465 RepID=A0A4V3E129_9SPHI|nr:glycosyltransferase family 1 protein [Sphingobacterium paludis]TDS11096.1 glycosyltransferase involved in cell wall biosynthesis [Sphingobacterium paludis]
MEQLQILFDAERMKYPHTGLYHFCLNLGLALQDLAPDNASLTFFLNKQVEKPFQVGARYIPQHSHQKFLKPRFSQFDVWHSTFQLTAYLPADRRVKVLSTIHDLNFLKEGKSEQKVARYLKKIQALIDRSDVVVAISNYVKSDIEHYCSLDGKTVHVIYNGNNINEQLLLDTEKNAPLVPEDYIYSIGTINKKKNFHVLLYLLVGNNLKLVISGIVHEPEYLQKIQTLAASLGVNDRVIITGPVSEADKYNYLANCSVFAFPSITEGFGLPVIEAMSFGKKVLLSKFTSLPEVGGEEAFYLESMDEEYLSDYGRNNLIKLIQTPTRVDEIKAWASQFSWEKAAAKYWRLYATLSNR